MRTIRVAVLWVLAAILVSYNLQQPGSDMVWLVLIFLTVATVAAVLATNLLGRIKS